MRRRSGTCVERRACAGGTVCDPAAAGHREPAARARTDGVQPIQDQVASHIPSERPLPSGPGLLVSQGSAGSRPRPPPVLPCAITFRHLSLCLEVAYVLSQPRTCPLCTFPQCTLDVQLELSASFPSPGPQETFSTGGNGTRDQRVSQGPESRRPTPGAAWR